jgi:tetratricopeptide (TPR) repeat protein
VTERRLTRIAAELSRASAEPAAVDAAQWADDQLAIVPLHRWPIVVADDSRFHHRVIARHLLTRASTLHDQKGRTRDALRAAETASTIFGILGAARPDDASLALDRAEALKEQAVYWTELSGYQMALDAIESGEMLIASIESPEAELLRARLLFARAIVYGDEDVCRYDDALALLDRASETFDRLKHVERHLAVDRMRANVLILLRHLAPARELLMSLLTRIEAVGGIEYAQLLQCVATCAILRGDAVEAVSYAERARAIHSEHENARDIARAQWVIGRAKEIELDYESAARSFDEAAAVFARLNMLDLWIRVRLDFVHSKLAADPNADVRVLCESIAAMSVALDQRDGNRRRHATAEACDYLRRLASTNAVSADTVGYIRAFVDEISERSPRTFVPAEPEIQM